MKSKISVIVPTYNRAHIITMCLDSLVVQNYPKENYEIIVVNNNSSDNTKEIVRKYINNYPSVSIRNILEKRPGLVYARHTGAKHAKYDTLSFTDDDGILCKNWLKEVSNVFQANPEVAAVAGKIVIKWDKEPPDWVKPYEGLLGKLDYSDKTKYEKNISICGGNYHIKKSILFKLGGFNPDQIGDCLIGDGETGLNQKLWNCDYLIGWAPKAIMEHFQTVEKNATIKDIKRRFINNGIAIPYRIFVTQGKGSPSLIKNLIKVIKPIIKLQVKIIYFAIKGKKQEKYSSIFQLSYYIFQFPYTFKLIFNKRFAKYIRNTEWF
jgi:glycosyltransferase involved in cell wall biosynthesis